MGIKSVIIGAGHMGRRHIANIRAVKDFDFCGISDLRPEALELAAAENVDRDSLFYDTAKMFDEVKPEFALVSTTAISHFELAKLAVEKGVRLLMVEKPFCVSIKQAMELRDLCAKKNIRLAVNHGMRFDAHYMRALELTRQPDLGPITSVTVIGGNMGIAMNLSHQFELFRLLTGQPVSKVAAWLDHDPCPNPRGSQFNDGAGRVIAENDSGQRFYADISPDQWHGFRMIITMRFSQLDIDFFTLKATLSRRLPEYLKNPSTRYRSPFECGEYQLPPPEDTHIRALKAFISGENYPDGEIGEHIIRVLTAIWVSNENGHMAVDVNGALPEEREFTWA